jgi:hypothetical protein
MDRLLEDYTYGDVARILNEKGFKTGDGLSLTSGVVGSIRTLYGLRARFDRLRERVMLTIAEMAQTCGVATTTIAPGSDPPASFNDRNEVLYEHPGPNPPRRGMRTSATAA